MPCSRLKQRGSKAVLQLKEAPMPWNKPYSEPRNSRLEPNAYQLVNAVYFITIRAYGRASPFTNAGLNQCLIETLHEEEIRHNCSVYTYCLMPDHLHFLVSPQREGASVLRFTDAYKGKTTNRSWSHGWKGRLWQPRYFDHMGRREESLVAISEYILNNPVRAGLAGRPEEWQWSGYISRWPA